MAQRWGLTLPLPGTPLHAHEELVKRAEAAGYTDFWSGETNGPDGFTPLRPERRLDRAGAARDRDRRRLPARARRCWLRRRRRSPTPRRALRARHRLLLGPHRRRLERDSLRAPLSKVRESLEFLRTALEGERTASGFKLETRPAERVPIVLAALRGKMLDLAVERADGAFTNFLPLAGLPKVTAQLEGAPDGFELLCRFFCLPGEREAVEPLARFMFSSYITVPVYAAFYRWLGYGEQIDAMVAAWEAGDRQAAAAAAPWELIEDMFIFGTPEQMRERLDAFVAGGVTLPVLTPIVPPDALGETIEALSP
jgi:alkanesulfonate monooxygenase SsuD/methylene tetrahydromethanopterin reductase-like flavin-dependent oxidoreductase (luciferase family)